MLAGLIKYFINILHPTKGMSKKIWIPVAIVIGVLILSGCGSSGGSSSSSGGSSSSSGGSSSSRESDSVRDTKAIGREVARETSEAADNAYTKARCEKDFLICKGECGPGPLQGQCRDIKCRTYYEACTRKIVEHGRGR